MERRKFLQHTLLTTAGLTLVPVLTKGITLVQSKISPITISAKSNNTVSLHHIWSNCIVAAKAKDMLRATWLENLKFVKDNCGFKYVRIWGLCNQNMLIQTGSDGQYQYHWHLIDDLLDRLLDIGVRPFIELKLSLKKQGSQDLWSEKIFALATHCISRYGAEEVRTWPFEVLKCQSPEEYKFIAERIKSIDSQLKIGFFQPSNVSKDSDLTLTMMAGPEVKINDELTGKFEQFLGYCKNNCIPIDFISVKYDPHENQSTPYRISPLTIKQACKKHSFSTTDIHLVFASKIPIRNNKLISSASILKANLRDVELPESLSYFSITNIPKKSNPDLCETPELVNYQGIPQQAFHGYKMLRELGDVILHKEEGVIVTRQSSNGKIIALLYHCPMETEMNLNKDRNILLYITDLAPNTSFIIETVDGETQYDGQQEGKKNLKISSRKEILEIRQVSRSGRKETYTTDANRVLRFEKAMKPWSSICIRQV